MANVQGKLMIFPSPIDAGCVLTSDQGWSVRGEPGSDEAGRPGVAFSVPEGTPSGWGSRLVIEAEGMVTIEQRGLLVLDGSRWLFYADDFHMQPMPEPPAPEEPDEPDVEPGEQSPQEIIQEVWETGEYQLVTKEGCGLFTEACCEVLHDKHSKAWGHVRKHEGQNQYNGHAVDAVMLGANAPDCENGIYDIIQSSESPEAKAVFNYAGPADPDLWYYPA